MEKFLWVVIGFALSQILNLFLRRRRRKNGVWLKLSDDARAVLIRLARGAEHAPLTNGMRIAVGLGKSIIEEVEQGRQILVVEPGGRVIKEIRLPTGTN